MLNERDCNLQVYRNINMIEVQNLHEGSSKQDIFMCMRSVPESNFFSGFSSVVNYKQMIRWNEIELYRIIQHIAGPLCSPASSQIWPEILGTSHLGLFTPLKSSDAGFYVILRVRVCRIRLKPSVGLYKCYECSLIRQLLSADVARFCCFGQETQWC